MDTVLQECQSLPSWPESAASPLALEERALFLMEILKFLGTAALIVVAGVVLLLVG